MGRKWQGSLAHDQLSVLILRQTVQNAAFSPTLSFVTSVNNDSTHSDNSSNRNAEEFRQFYVFTGSDSALVSISEPGIGSIEAFRVSKSALK